MPDSAPPLSVLAFEDIEPGDVVVVTGATARLYHYDGPVPATGLLAKAIETIKKGKHGHVRPLE